MINEQWKRDYTDKRGTLSKIVAVSRYEEELGKDACMFTHDEIRRIYLEMRTPRIQTLETINKELKRYTNWAIERGYCTSNPYDEFTIDELQELVEIGDIIKENELQGYCALEKDPTIRFLIAAPFFGFTNRNNYEDITRLKMTDVNKKNNTLSLVGRTVSVSSWFINVIITAFTATETTIGHVGGERKINLIGDGVVKYKDVGATYKDGDISYFIRNNYSRNINGKFDKETTYSKILSSGIAHFTNVVMQQHDTENVDDVWNSPDFRQEVMERFRLKGLTPYKFKLRFGQFIDNWRELE